MLNMQLKSLIPKFQNKRVRIVYDDAYPAISLLYGHILPYFRAKKLVFVTYSDSICRRLHEMYKSMNDDKMPAARLLEKALFIKIGQKECYPFEKPCARGYRDLVLIKEDRIFDYEFIENIVEYVTPDCILILAGFYLLPAIHGMRAVKGLYRFFSEIPEETTLFSFYPRNFLDERLNRLLEKLFDVVVSIKKEDEFFQFGGETYLIGIEQSIIRDIKPGYARFRIGEDWNLIEI